MWTQFFQSILMMIRCLCCNVSFIVALLSVVAFCSIIFEQPNDDIVDTFPCIINISKEYANNVNFVFVAEEMERLQPFEVEFIRRLPHTVLISDADNFQGTFGFFVFFPYNEDASYRKILARIRPYPYNRFLVVWPLRIDTSRLKSFISQFWQFKLVNVIVLVVTTNRSITIFGYNPYLEYSCNSPKIIEIDSCNTREGSFVRSSNLFPLAEKLTNLNKCKLYCFVKNRPPDSFVRRKEDDTWLLDGIGGKLMEIVQKRINFTAVIETPELTVSADKYGYDISRGFPELVAGLLNNLTVDLAFGIYSHIIYDNPTTEFSVSAVSECYGWAVPAHSGKEVSVWMYYTQEFEFSVWLLILFVYCSSLILFAFVLRIHPANVIETTNKSFDRITFAALHVFALHLGQVSSRITYSRRRIAVSALILYSLILTLAYQSSLGSFLTVPWKREQIKTFREILRGGFDCIGIPQGKRILQRFSSDSRLLVRLSKRYRVYENHFDTLVTKMQQRKNIATFGAQRFVQFYINHNLNASDRDDIYFLPKCVIVAHSSPFLFKKNSPFLKPINDIISAAIESGLTQYWYSYSTPKIFSSSVNVFALKLHQLESPIDLLLIGYCLATFVFVIELCFSQREFIFFGLTWKKNL